MTITEEGNEIKIERTGEIIALEWNGDPQLLKGIREEDLEYYISERVDEVTRILEEDGAPPLNEDEELELIEKIAEFIQKRIGETNDETASGV